jgi:predicted transcriptional regulator
VMSAVDDAGYKSTSEKFNIIVNQRLSRMTDDGYLKKPGRGQYRIGAKGIKWVEQISATATE